MLEFDAERRMNLEDIMVHPYFAEVQWQAVYDRKVAREL